MQLIFDKDPENMLVNMNVYWEDFTVSTRFVFAKENTLKFLVVAGKIVQIKDMEFILEAVLTWNLQVKKKKMLVHIPFILRRHFCVN